MNSSAQSLFLVPVGSRLHLKPSLCYQLIPLGLEPFHTFLFLSRGVSPNIFCIFCLLEVWIVYSL